MCESGHERAYLCPRVDGPLVCLCEWLRGKGKDVKQLGVNCESCESSAVCVGQVWVPKWLVHVWRGRGLRVSLYP